MEDSAEKSSMSMISRYKRPGGFVQLLSLIETSGQAKKDRFLEIIRTESKDWAVAIEKHCLSLDRIFTWSDDTVVEIFKALPLRNMACALNGIPEEQKDRVMNYLSHSEKRKVTDEMGSLNANNDEFNGTLVKLLEITRKMISEGQLRLEKVDPELEIPENIEDQLAKDSSAHPAKSTFEERRSEQLQEAISKAERATGNGSAEVANLQRIAQALTKENKALKEENRVLKEKLEQIRKIA